MTFAAVYWLGVAFLTGGYAVATERDREIGRAPKTPFVAVLAISLGWPITMPFALYRILRGAK